MGTGLEDVSLPDNGEETPAKRGLVIAAHPDDTEFGVGGTAALWSRDGWEFYYLICTDGSKGSEDPEMTAERLVPLRREEQRAAAKVLGVKDVFFLDYVDGELTYTRELMRDVVRYIRRLRPYAVFSHDPNQIVRNMFINHPDHRCAGTVALDAVYPIARNRPSFPELLDEGLEPFSVSEVYLWGASDTTLDVDVTSVADLKFRALMQHKSQFVGMEERMKGWRERWTEPDGRFLERFRHIELPF
ncbi:MAG TPA: PIG-L deacetylase family protein [Dehalococcoidia bacterium]|nr:PIG-L deacetylase family protein [Dehalococcoidia bacterium]